jgi:hypothetical protein
VHARLTAGAFAKGFLKKKGYKKKSTEKDLVEPTKAEG